MQTAKDQVVFQGVDSGTLSGTPTVLGAPVNLSHAEHAAFQLVGTASGTGISITVKLQYSIDGTNWLDLIGGAFAAIAAAGAVNLGLVVAPLVPAYLRCVATGTGTTPRLNPIALYATVKE